VMTLGIDLAAEPKDTAGCEMEWSNGAARVRWVDTDLTDDDILERAGRVDAVGIDAPFGWPTLFVDAITAHQAGRSWPVDAWTKESRRGLRLRATDERVYAITRITPLSVSSDSIAIPATRCAFLLDRLHVRDRAADARVREVYPAAALRQWGLRHNRYKGPDNRPALRGLVASLRGRAPWLAITPTDAELLAACDDAFDALIASLSARAAFRGLTHEPTREEMAAALVEGWIALPQKGSLEALPRAVR